MSQQQKKNYDVEFHPLAEVMPMIGPEAWDAFQKDIERHGVLEPVRFIKGEKGKHVFVDGRNRLRAAEAVGIPLKKIPKEEWKPAYEGQTLLDFVTSANMQGRRHLSKSQAAAVAILFYHAGRDSGEIEEPATDWAKWVADKFASNRMYVYQAEKLYRHKQHGMPLLLQVKAGVISIDAAEAKLAELTNPKPATEADDGNGKAEDAEDAVSDSGAELAAPAAGDPAAGGGADHYDQGPVQDGRGEVVPDDFKPVFLQRNLFRNVRQRLEEAYNSFQDILKGPAAGAFRLGIDDAEDEVDRCIKRAMAVVEHVAPHAVCPDCGGTGRQGGKKPGTGHRCKRCLGLTFVNAARFTAKGEEEATDEKVA